MHHQQHVVGLVQEALKLANLQPADIDAIAFTKVCPLRQPARARAMLPFRDASGIRVVVAGREPRGNCEPVRNNVSYDRRRVRRGRAWAARC